MKFSLASIVLVTAWVFQCWHNADASKQEDQHQHHDVVAQQRHLKGRNHNQHVPRKGMTGKRGGSASSKRGRDPGRTSVYLRRQRLRSRARSRGRRSPPTSITTTPSPSTTPVGGETSPLVPICRVDTATGIFIPPTDPRYEAIDGSTTEITSASVTFDDLGVGADTVADSLATFSAGVDILTDIDDFSKRAKGVFAILGIAASVYSIWSTFALPAFGIDSTEQQQIDRIEAGFNQINDRLTDIQIQLRDGFQEITTLISDSTLDQITSRLDALGRVFNDLTNSTGTIRTTYYEPLFRSLCNEPFQRPIDIFYDLYGYGCRNCTFASRKRADLLTFARERFDLSGSSFFSNFGGYLLRSMTTAANFHAVCPGPLAGACIDSEPGDAFSQSILHMEEAFGEVTDNILSVVDELKQWVNNIRQGDILPFVEGDDPQTIAVTILNFLVGLQPTFDLQTFVIKRTSPLNDLIQGFGCDKDSGNFCATEETKTGQFFFGNVKNHLVLVRYRSKLLPFPSTNVTLGGNSTTFESFFQEVVVSNLDSIANVYRARETGFCQGSSRPDLPGILDQYATIGACGVPQCFDCTPGGEEQQAYDEAVGNNDITIIRTSYGTDALFLPSIGQASTSEVAFPKIDVTAPAYIDKPVAADIPVEESFSFWY